MRIEEVPFNTDVLNSDTGIFFPSFRNRFSLLRFETPGSNLPQYVYNAMDYLLEEYCYEPDFFLIPFMVYGLYSAWWNPDSFHLSLTDVCEELKLNYVVLTPDRLKQCVKVNDNGDLRKGSKTIVSEILKPKLYGKEVPNNNDREPAAPID